MLTPFVLLLVFASIVLEPSICIVNVPNKIPVYRSYSYNPNLPDIPILGCSNWHPQCTQWAEYGECEANPRYMLEFCPKACWICKVIAYLPQPCGLGFVNPALTPFLSLPFPPRPPLNISPPGTPVVFNQSMGVGGYGTPSVGFAPGQDKGFIVPAPVNVVAAPGAAPPSPPPPGYYFNVKIPKPIFKNVLVPGTTTTTKPPGRRKRQTAATPVATPTVTSAATPATATLVATPTVTSAAIPANATLHPLPATTCPCLDVLTECYFWMLDGQCTLNPDWMLVNCRLSCLACGYNTLFG